MEKIGQTLKFFRKARNLSQRKTAEGIMDLSYYSRVENDKLNITFSKLAKLLRRLDISLEEFSFVNEKSSNSKRDDIHDCVKQAYYDENIKELLNFKKICANKFDESGQISYRHTYLLCTYLLANRQKCEWKQEYTQEIKDYLNSLSYYTKSDVKLLENFYKILPPEMVFYIFENFFITKRHYTALETSEEAVLLFYLNIIALALEQQEIVRAKKILIVAKHDFNNKLNLLATTIFKFYDGVFLILDKIDISLGTKMANDAIKVLEICELNFQAKAHRDYLIKITNDSI